VLKSLGQKTDKLAACKVTRLFTSLFWLFLFSLSFAGLAVSASTPEYNYKLFCQGCHLPDGSGVPAEVPSLINQLSRFINLPEGREYIVQVPGVMQALLTDSELADLLNWVLENFDKELSSDFLPYTEKEISDIRSKGYVDVVEKRRLIMKIISEENF